VEKAVVVVVVVEREWRAKLSIFTLFLCVFYVTGIGRERYTGGEGEGAETTRIVCCV
jgi:hypothetical protein